MPVLELITTGTVFAIGLAHEIIVIIERKRKTFWKYKNAFYSQNQEEIFT